MNIIYSNLKFTISCWLIEPGRHNCLLVGLVPPGAYLRQQLVARDASAHREICRNNWSHEGIRLVVRPVRSALGPPGALQSLDASDEPSPSAAGA